MPPEISYPLRVRGAWTDVAPDRRRAMQSNRRRDTGPELSLRRELHRRGLRYRVDHPIRIAGHRLIRPDVVFTARRVVVFVDGCFWHGCPDHGSTPDRNAGYWGPKLAANAARDARTTAALAAAGWRVVRVWEHEPPFAAAERVVAALRGVGAAGSSRPA